MADPRSRYPHPRGRPARMHQKGRFGRRRPRRSRGPARPIIAIPIPPRRPLTACGESRGSESTVAIEFRTLNGMAMGKNPAARQASPMCVNTEDRPTTSGHLFFERPDGILAESRFDTFVEAFSAAFYADGLGRPSCRSGRYCR